MLETKTPIETYELIDKQFSSIIKLEKIALDDAIGRVIAEDVIAKEYVPSFTRSTVDGYALRASDSFGCSDSIPALLEYQGEVLMGKQAPELKKGSTVYIPTGGALPSGADSVCMIEYAEDFKDGTIGIEKAVAPGNNLIFKGDDCKPGDLLYKKGTVLSISDIGFLAAVGIKEVSVLKRIKVGIISTGDELVRPGEEIKEGQIRDINSSILAGLFKKWDCIVKNYGIVSDNENMLRNVINEAVDNNDLVVLSGGSSVGVKDMSCRLIEEHGTVLLHGIAVKPGKPTILGKVNDHKAIVGLPGNPVAAYFITLSFVKALVEKLSGKKHKEMFVNALISENISANHGRAQFTPVKLFDLENKLYAKPMHIKSGLISTLKDCDGFVTIDRDKEGIMQGESYEVQLFD